MGDRLTLAPFFNKPEGKTSRFLDSEIVSDPSVHAGLSTSRSGRPEDFDAMNDFFINAIPYPIRETFHELGYQNIYTNHVYDIYSRESEVRETDPYDRRKKNGQMGGWSLSDDQVAFTAKEQWVGRRGFLVEENSPDKVRHTILHEFGHQFSRVFRLENLAAFKDTLDSDITAYGSYDRLRKEGNGYLTPSEERPYRHREEAWAELCAVAFGSEDAHAKERAASFPNAYNVVQDMIASVTKGLEDGIDFLTLRSQIREEFDRGTLGPDIHRDYEPF